MKEQFGDTQVREVQFTRAEIVQLIVDNMKARGASGYDFDYDAPLVIKFDAQGVKLRFVQIGMTREESIRDFHWRDLLKKKEE